MRNRVGPQTATRNASPIIKDRGHRPRVPISLDWERRSSRLWVAEYQGRSFRIERAGDAARNTGGVVVIEWDKYHKPILKEPADTVTQGKQLVEVWLLNG